MIHLQIDQMKLQCNVTSLSIYDGPEKKETACLATLCDYTSTGMSYTSTTDVMVLHLTASSGNASMGFTLHWNAVGEYHNMSHKLCLIDSISQVKHWHVLSPQIHVYWIKIIPMNVDGYRDSISLNRLIILLVCWYISDVAVCCTLHRNRGDLWERISAVIDNAMLHHKILRVFILSKYVQGKTLMGIFWVKGDSEMCRYIGSLWRIRTQC